MFLSMNSGVEQGGILAPRGAWWSAAGAPRFEGLSVADYAQAMAQRERILDEAAVRKHGSVLSGDVADAWARLREHAARFGLPLVERDLDATNRIKNWDELVLNDARTQDEWRREYPRALARVCSLDPDDAVGRAFVAHFAAQPALLWNPFVPLTLRRPGVTEDVRHHARRAQRAPSNAPPAPALSSAPPPADVTVFPGEKIATLSDFARLQCAVQTGDFMGALYREGLDPMQYARVADRWAARLAGDPALRAEYASTLRRHAGLADTCIRPGDLAPIAPAPSAAPAPPAPSAAPAPPAPPAHATAPLPARDPLVFPGQKLAHVSDFARVSRAAKRGEFKRALERAGVDGETWASLCARFNAKMAEDKGIEEAFTRLLSDPRVDA